MIRVRLQPANSAAMTNSSSRRERKRPRTTRASSVQPISETSLSFLGLGLRPPAISWGVLLQQAQSVQALAISPWLLIPAVPVIVVIIACNFMGDGLRDAADPY